MKMFILMFAVCLLATVGARVRAQSARDLRLLPTDPPSLTVRVSGGSWTGPAGERVDVAPGELNFDPPQVAEATCSDAIPRGVNPDQIGPSLWKSWNAFSMLPPENPQILGIFYRGILPDSVVLRSHDGSRRFERGRDYVLNEEQGLILGVGNRLGKRPGDPKRPKPHETLRAEFKYFMQRLDLVQVNADGELSIKKSDSVIMCPVLPEPDPGHAAVAGVWVYGAHSDGPVPNSPERVAIEDGDICMVRPRPPVKPVNPEALGPAVEKLKAGRPIGIGFFGDSIAVGAEVRDWYNYIWSPRNKGFIGMVVRDLRERYPEADVQPAWGISGAQSIFNEGLWESCTRRAREPEGEYVWWEAEEPESSGNIGPAPEEYELRTPGESRVVSEGEWLVLAGESGDDRPYATYRVDVPKAGAYHFFVRQSHKRGELRWRWDDGSWTRQPPGHPFTDADNVRRGLPLCWNDMGALDLDAGRHTLRVELIPAEGNAAATAVDCFALTQDEPGPWRKYRPGELTVDVVVYAMGMNGSFNERTPREKHKETILRHIREAREKGAEVLLVSTMENNCRLVDEPEKSKKGNRDLMAEIARETGCAFADVYTEWMNQEYRGIPPESRLHNFLNHPDVVGHRLWADVILRCFEAAE